MTALANQVQVSVLIVGCGNIAGGFDMARPHDALPVTHAGAFSRHPGFRIAACVDPDASRRQAFAQHWQIPTHAASINALQARAGEFDVISVCSPTAVHHEHLCTALSLKPRVIFCEKPLTATEEDSAKWVAACHEQGATLVVNYTRRWDPAVDTLIEELQAGRWGRIRSIVGHYNKGILNNGGHLIDLLLRLVGPMDLVATLGCEYDHWPDDPTVAALLRNRASGLPVYLNPSDARDYSFFELELVCENGVVRMQTGGLQWQYREAAASPQFKGYKALTGARDCEGQYLQAMNRAVSDIHRHLADGIELTSSGANALEVQHLCLRIRESAEAAMLQPADHS